LRFFFSSRRRHTSSLRDWSSDVCSSDLGGNFITAKPIGIVDGIDMGLTGEVRRIDVEGLRQRLDDGDLALVSPLGYSPTGEIFNLALEEVATQVALRLSAHKLTLLTETD